MVIIIIFKKTSTYNVSLPHFLFLLRANSLLFSAEKHLNVHFPHFRISVFLLQDITATTANQRNTP